ncbi:hypothetical protein AAV94_09240 [Lampropedia cohaerens]|uniref:General secretion pathway protein GspM n=1 Tax=Lampropedia cohaerens TaxID=1610491 RepID=A0A0U1PZL0_9BURK|nr:type II secretion system protein GspM [Lampropedia cohaerens]KKW67795.1 hypothetical protein AAV94_09240 [Lampropedia cohaerens]
MNADTARKWQDLRAAAAARWQSMPARERRLVTVALLVVLAALLWRVAILPAWQTWQSYPASRAALERQVQQMQGMRQQALQMQQAVASSGASANAATLHRDILASAQRLLGGDAQATLAGDRITVRFQAAPAQALAEWLAQTQTSARAQPVQVTLEQAVAQDAGVAWKGQIVLALPVDGSR